MIRSISSSNVSSVPPFACVSPIFGPVRELVGKVAKFLAPEALDLDEVPRIPMVIICVCFAIDQVVVVILSENDGTGGCM